MRQIKAQDIFYFISAKRFERLESLYKKLRRKNAFFATNKNSLLLHFLDVKAGEATPSW